jgi:hypothetical protein
MIDFWRDLNTGPSPPGEVSAVVEIPKGNENKYEYDVTKGPSFSIACYTPLCIWWGRRDSPLLAVHMIEGRGSRVEELTLRGRVDSRLRDQKPPLSNSSASNWRRLTKSTSNSYLYLLGLMVEGRQLAEC